MFACFIRFSNDIVFWPICDSWEALDVQLLINLLIRFNQLMDESMDYKSYHQKTMKFQFILRYHSVSIKYSSACGLGWHNLWDVSCLQKEIKCINGFNIINRLLETKLTRFSSGHIYSRVDQTSPSILKNGMWL